MWTLPVGIHDEFLDKLVAIVVPYRNKHASQKRDTQLRSFIDQLPKIFNSVSDMRFKIYIVEQSDDERKFNRGKLLNIGYTYAKADQATHIIFHDVDLLPDPLLASEYFRQPPERTPYHIARVWERYSSNPNYLGGVLSMTMTDFEALNGHSNRFWGWGGEDDDLRIRLAECSFTPFAPDSGRMIDMEDMNLSTKLQFLRKNMSWKCMSKQELLAETTSTWRDDGLSDLTFTEITQTELLPHNIAVKITVNLGLNHGHWTDAVSHETCTTWGKPSV